MTYDGTTYEIAQVNNALVFPGLGLGVIVARATRITDGMLLAAAEAVAGTADTSGAGASLLPRVADLRATSAVVAATQAAVQVGRRSGVDVVAWTLPESVTRQLDDDGFHGFVGVPDSAVDVIVEIDRAAQLAAVQEHPSQAVPGSPLWRRLELLGDREHLRYLHNERSGNTLPFGRAVTAEPA